MTKSRLLTEGSIAKHLIILAAPLILGNILQQFYNLINSMAVGRYVGVDAFAALGVAGTVMNLFIFIIGGSCVGIAVITANLFGQGDISKLRQECSLAMIIGGIITVVLMILGLICMDLILKAIQTPEELMSYIHTYLTIIFCGLPFCFAYNLCAAILRAVGNTYMALVFLVISLITNVILIYILVVRLDMGVAGCAISTISSQALSALLCIVYIRRNIPELKIGKSDFIYDSRLAKRILQFALTCALQQSSLYIGKILVQGAVNGQGTVAIAAFTAVTLVEGIILTLGDGGGEAISVFVAQNMGKGKFERARQGLFKGMKIFLVLGMTVALVLLPVVDKVLLFFMPDASTAVIAMGVSYYKVMCLLYALAIMGSSFQGFFRGSGHINITLFCTTLHITLRVIFTFILISALGINAVAVAVGIGWSALIVVQSTLCAKVSRRERERAGQALEY